jgi:enoyl-[acyl-carrier protein] reductase II
MCGKVSHAVAAAEAGCDVVVAQGTEAGGHTGRIGGFALLPQIVDAVDIPVLAAGSIVDGRGLAASLAFGAQGIWMGTRFIASHEARAAEEYKKSVTRIRDEDTVVSRGYSGKPMRVIANQYTAERERHPELNLPFPEQMAESAKSGVLVALAGGAQPIDPAVACMPCGQGAGAINEILSCREIIDNVMREATQTMADLGALASR